MNIGKLIGGFIGACEQAGIGGPAFAPGEKEKIAAMGLLASGVTVNSISAEITVFGVKIDYNYDLTHFDQDGFIGAVIEVIKSQQVPEKTEEILENEA